MAAFTRNIFFLQEQATGFTAQLIDLEKTRARYCLVSAIELKI